jgi:deazaflavin-dependent oxidoreductase (nitroreductase family)
MGRSSLIRGRRLNAYEQAMERFAASRIGGWLFVHVLTHGDRRLLTLTRGRASLEPAAPVGLLETTGARSGERRLTPVLYLGRGEALALVASNVGRERHPAWLHNLRADPDVRFLARGGWGRYRARVALGDERERLWPELTDLYAGYDAYAARTARDIAVVVLEPRAVTTRSGAA